MGKTAPFLPPRRLEFPSQRKTCEITVKSSRQGLARGKQRVSHYFPLSRAFQGLEEEKVSQDRARRERQARSPNLGLTPTPLPRARRECPDPGAAGRSRLRPAAHTGSRGQPVLPRATRAARPEMASAALPLCAVPESRASLSRAGPAPRSVAVTGRAAVARPRPAQTAPPLPPPRRSALAPATVSRTPPPRGWTDTRVPGLLGSLRWKGRRPPSPVLASPRSAVPPAATSQTRSAALRALTVCVKLAEAPPAASWLKLFFGDFWGIFRRDPGVALRSHRLSLPSR